MTDFSTMLLLDGGRAPNPRRVSIFMAEKGIEIPRRQIDINAGEQRSPELSRHNPVQRVPVLVLEDGTAIAESVAICRYLDALVPEPPLFGEGALEQALVEMWQRRVEFGLLLPVAFAFRHLHPGAAVLEQPQIAVWGEANKPRAVEFLGVLDAALAHSRFVAGERFTIADITAAVAIGFMKPARIELPSALVNLRRWLDDVSARPSMAS